MENFKIIEIPEFDDEEITGLINNLVKSFNAVQNSFASTCEGVYKIWNYFNHTYKNAKDGCYYNSYALLEKFGFDKKAVSRYKNCYLRFCVNSGAGVRLSSLYSDFSPSKLFELLPLTDDVIIDGIKKKVLSPQKTVKELRQIVKFLVNGEDIDKLVDKTFDSEEKEEIDESEIPLAYDPVKEYDFDYFKSKTKNQLLNMIWELQSVYQKLKRKGAK